MTAPRSPDDIRRLRKKQHAITRARLCGNILTVARDRYGKRLPDDEAGRAMLKAMLAVGVYHVLRWAPWVRREELEGIIALIDAAPKGYWDGAKLGHEIGLIHAERERLKVWWLHSRHREKELQSVQERKAQALREKREKMKMKLETALIDTNMHERRESLLKLLQVFGEMSATQMAEKLATAIAWCCPDGMLMTSASLLRSVRRMVNDLAQEGVLAIREERQHNGWMTRFVRLNAEIVSLKTPEKITKSRVKTGNAQIIPIDTYKKRR
jgi:hypothetical protein